MDLRHLTFRLLQVYQHIVDTGSISKAARALHLTQPTVSLQLKKLTEEFGEPLVEHKKGQLVPTYAGEALYHAIQDVFSRFHDLTDELAKVKGGHAGQLSLGIVTTAKYVMPSILGAFDTRYPKINLTLNVGNRAHVLTRFAQQDDDLYLFSQPPTGDLVQAGRIMKNPLRLLVPKNHWVCKLPWPVHFSQLKNERFLMREPGSATRMQFEAWLSGQGIELTNTMQIESNEAIRLSVAAGLGVAVLSDYALQPQETAVCTVDVVGFPLQSHWYLVARKDKRLSAAAKRFIQFLSEELAHCVEPSCIVEDIAELWAHFEGVHSHSTLSK